MTTVRDSKGRSSPRSASCPLVVSEAASSGAESVSVVLMAASRRSSSRPAIFQRLLSNYCLDPHQAVSTSTALLTSYNVAPLTVSRLDSSAARMFATVKSKFNDCRFIVVTVVKEKNIY